MKLLEPANNARFSKELTSLNEQALIRHMCHRLEKIDKSKDLSNLVENDNSTKEVIISISLLKYIITSTGLINFQVRYM